MQVRLAAAALLLLLTAVLVWALRPASVDPQPSPAPSPSPAGTETGAAAGAPVPVPTPTPAPPPGAPPPEPRMPDAAPAAPAAPPRPAPAVLERLRPAPTRAELPGEGLQHTAAAGALRKEDIQDAVVAIKPLLGRCYEEALAHDPTLAGTLKVRFTLVKDQGVGRLEDAEVLDEEGALYHPFLGMCVLRVLAGVSYPAPGQGSVTVTYPFNLQPEPEAPE